MEYTISNIRKLLLEKKITPSKLIINIYQNLEKFETLNFFVTKTKDIAIKIAKELDKIPVDKNNILFGIPYASKDNFVTKNIKTTASSNILNNFIPPYNAKVISDLNEKQTILLGKTTMDELGMGGTGLTANNGKVLNPWNKNYIAGGSSSGSAVLVSTGLVPFALATDTGDSIRKPASFCGVVGFKPTYGVISRNGVIPYSPSFDTVGFFTQNVLDSAILFSELLNYDDNDYSIKKHSYDYKKISKNIKGYNIAYIKEIYDDTNPELLNELNFIFQELKKQGVNIKPISFNIELLKALLPVYFIITCVEAISSQSNLNGILFGKNEKGKNWEESVTKSRSKNLGKIIQFRYIIGQYASSENNQEALFLYAKKIRRLIVNELNKIYKSFDAIIGLPVNSHTKKINEIKKDVVIFSEDDITGNFLLLANFNGMPSITIPLNFWKKDKMPYGININTNIFDEEKLFNIALSIEEITGLKNLKAGEYN